MEQNIIDVAAGCKNTAAMLETAAAEAVNDFGELTDLHGILLRLFYAIGLEDKMMECEASLSEDTDADTVDAVLGASAAVDAASAKMFAHIEEYVSGNDALAAEIDALTLSEKADDIDDLLKKLYKCEGIIRMAYRCSSRYPIYGMKTTDAQHAVQKDSSNVYADAGEPPEDYMKDRLGVDIEALYMIRQKLLRLIEALLVEDGA